MKCFFKPFIRNIFILILGFVSLDVRANECESFLAEKAEALDVLTLPGKNHEFSRDIINQLPEIHQYTIYALYDALHTLDHAEIVDVLKNLNQPLSYSIDDEAPTIEIPDELTAIITRNHKAEEVKNYYIFFTSELGTENYDVRTRIGLSLLFSLVPKPKNPLKALFATHEFKNDAQWKRLRDYFDRLIKTPQNAHAIMNFVENPYVAYVTQAGLNKMLKKQIDLNKKLIQSSSLQLKDEALDAYVDNAIADLNKIAKLDTEKIRNEYERKKQFSSQSLIQIEEVLANFSDMIINSLNSKLRELRNYEEIEESIRTVADLPYEFRRELFESFLAEVSGFKSGLDNIVSLLDHLCFGSSIPLKSDQVEYFMYEALKLWLMPVRNQVSQLRVAQKNLVQLQTKPRVETVLLKPEWGHASPFKEPQQLNPNKRKNQVKDSRKESKTETSVLSENIEIPEDLNLFNYTVFASNSRPLSDLEVKKIYKFRFMREGEDSKIQTIEFTKEVLDQFEDSSVAAKNFIRALNLGFARSSNEDGLKILKANRPGSEGRFYELKTMKSGDRLILHHNNGHWKALKYTDKNNFLRVLQDLI